MATKHRQQVLRHEPLKRCTLSVNIDIAQLRALLSWSGVSTTSEHGCPFVRIGAIRLGCVHSSSDLPGFRRFQPLNFNYLGQVQADRVYNCHLHLILVVMFSHLGKSE